VATGVGTWTSPDGASWSERRETLGLSVNGAATRNSALWVALDDGVRALEGDGAVGLTADRSAMVAHAPILAPLAPPNARSPWSLPWPRVTFGFVEQRTPVRGRWEAFVLIAIPFGRAPRPNGAAAQIATATSERDAALAAAATTFASRGDDESAAYARAAVQEREALRP
jgi:hypothetical protein